MAHGPSVPPWLTGRQYPRLTGHQCPNAPSELVPPWLTGRQYPTPSESVPQAHTGGKSPTLATAGSSSRGTSGNRGPSESPASGRTSGQSSDAQAARRCPSRTALDQTLNETCLLYPDRRGQATMPPSGTTRSTTTTANRARRSDPDPSPCLRHRGLRALASESGSGGERGGGNRDDL